MIKKRVMQIEAIYNTEDADLSECSLQELTQECITGCASGYITTISHEEISEEQAKDELENKHGSDSAFILGEEE